MGMCIKGLFWPPLEPKTENCFSPISFDWFIRGISGVLNFGIYFNFTVNVAKMANKIGSKQRIQSAILDQIKGFWRRNFEESDISTAKYIKKKLLMC